MKNRALKNKLLVSAAMLASSSFAAELDITVTNLTQGLHFTPIISGAHVTSANLFQVGVAATTELQAMAEGGDIAGLNTLLDGIGADVNANPASGLLAPAASTNFSLSTTAGNDVLSMTAMLLPTNDGFMGLSNWPIPSEAGTYVVYLNAYDAGTEANDEIVNGGGAPGAPGIPAAPGGNAGTGGTGVTTTEANGTVHIHRGALGDDNLTGGNSDLDNRVHRWLNPVARVTIVVQ